MTLATATISYNLADQVGTVFDYRRTKVWATTNVDDDIVIDSVGNQIRLGSGKGSLDENGDGTIEVWVPGTGSNPETWQTYFHVDYPDPADRTRRVVSFGPYTVTGDADLADLIEEQDAPAERSSLILAEMQALRDEVEEISGLTGEDAAVAALVADDGSDTATALSASFARLAGPLGGWKYKLSTTPGSAIAVFLGDSTSDYNVGAEIMYTRLQNLQTQQGEALFGMDPSNIVSGGNNGLTLGEWMGDPDSGTWNYNRDHLVSDAPDLTVAGWLTNDIRQGALGLTESAIFTAGRALLQTFVEWHRAALPNTDLLLRMPNTFLSADVGGAHYITNGSGGTNPVGLAQIYSTALRRIYLSFVGQYANVDVIDMQGEVFGTRSLASSPLMADQIHPSGLVSGDVNAITVVGGGYVAVADALAARIGAERNAFPAADVGVSRVRHEFIVYDAPTAGTVQLISRDYTVPAPQAPLTTADSLYVNGLAGPISLASATIGRNSGVNILQISGLGSTNFTPYIGSTATTLGNHAPATTGDRQLVYVDLPSIAAGSFGHYDCYVAGAIPGGNGVLMSPGASFRATSGMRYVNAWVTATDTVRVYAHNNGGANPTDVGGDNWDGWLIL